MDNTVVAVFDNIEDANLASKSLMDAGFSKDKARVTSQSDYGQDNEASSESQHDESGIGHFFRSLFNFGDDDREHDVYAESVRRGSYVVTAQADSEQQAHQAVEILNRFNPVDLDERSVHWRDQGWTGYEPAAPMFSADEIQTERSAYTGGRNQNTTESNTIPVIQEELQVGKRTVQRGGVRIVKRLVETPVEENITLREEHVHVERRPVTASAGAVAADLNAFEEGTIELTEQAEEAVIGKTARVVEEVVVSKDVTERNEAIKETVRSTDVKVEHTPGSNVATGTKTAGNDELNTSATLGSEDAALYDPERKVAER
jgi:uncharacterized protein (TIGR02271 family)